MVNYSYGFDDPDIDLKLFRYLANQSLFRRFSRLQFAAGELPPIRKFTEPAPLRREHPAITHAYRGGDFYCPDG